MLRLRRVNNSELQDIITQVNGDCYHKRRENLKVKNTEKINQLVRTQRSSNSLPQHSAKFYPRLVNLSNVQFDTRERQLLEKELKFALPPQSVQSTTDSL